MRGVSLTILAVSCLAVSCLAVSCLAVSCLAVQFTAEALAVDPPKTAEHLSRAATVRPADPVLVAHRGLLRHAPENTLPAFAACLELGFGFESDTRPLPAVGD